MERLCRQFIGLDDAKLIHCIVVPVVDRPRSRVALSVPATAEAKP